VDADGSIRTYRKEDYNLDMVAGGRALLFLYRRTKMEKYKTAADCLRRQLEQQPRTHAGGFWHKKIYPYQMWLDGLYMAEPFYARYAAMFDEPKAFDDIAAQFTLAYLHTLDPKTGLCYHGWDESRSQRWADSATGHSPCIWGRSMGWYLMGLVDVLDVFPADHPRRPELLKILRDLSAALLKYRDERSALWYQVVDRGGEDGNYLESSASSMFTYVFAKGARKGYLDRRFLRAARQSFDGIIKRFVRVDEQGFVNLTETCRGAGLGGDPYRDGSFAFYVGVPRATNDMKGIGACLLAAIQVESIPERTERQH
jgi:unsaturated rhamnogalacturonyl hydrolase